MKVPASVSRLEMNRFMIPRHLFVLRPTITVKGPEQSTSREKNCGLSLVAWKVRDPPSWGNIRLSTPKLVSPAAVPVPPWWHPISVMVPMKVEFLSRVGPGWASATAGIVANWSEG